MQHSKKDMLPILEYTNRQLSNNEKKKNTIYMMSIQRVYSLSFAANEEDERFEVD